MKQINYTGSSKLISRIVNLLNRKAPLPLDGDGDPDWGTNGQVLSTDGSGNTAWVNAGGGGDSVSWTQDVTTGTKIAEIDINGTTTDVYAPSAGSGGHTIWNRIKSALTQRGKLWFADASVSDVSADDATKVEVVTELLNETAFDNLATDGTADGIYAFPDSGGEYLTAAMSSYDNTASGLSASDVQGAIDELARSGGINYSTTERVIGTWIDGSAVYEKTFVYEPTSALTDGVHDLCTVGANLLPVDLDVVFINNTTMRSFKMPFSTSTGKNNVYFDDGKVKFMVEQDGWGVTYKAYITVKYIKTA